MSTIDGVVAKAEQLVGDSEFAAARALLESDRAQLEASFARSYLHGWACYHLEDLDTALASLGRASELEPEHPEPSYALGVIYGQLDEMSEAERCLKRSLELADSFEARFELAFLHHRQNRLMEAEALHRQNLDHYPELGDAYLALADFLSDVGRDREAQEQYARAMTLGAQGTA